MTRTESMLSRAIAKRISSFVFGTILTYSCVPIMNANAGFNPLQSTEQNLIDDVAALRLPINELLSDLTPNDQPNPIGVFSVQTLLKGGLDDSNVVLTYSSVYIKPLLSLMEKTATTVKLESEDDNKRFSLLPKLMLGHIIELDQAIKSQKASEQEKEVEEVVETLNEFLSLASKKYKVDVFKPVKPLTDAQLFGPLGCEFYGKVRVPGSNACVVK